MSDSVREYRDLVRGDVFAERYAVTGEIGRGAYGIVYDARDTMTEERVALKVLRPNRISLSSSRWREASALRRLNVPGVARLLDEGHVGDIPYVAMEFIDGDFFPGPRDPRTWDELRPHALQLLRILGVVHGEGVVHADLKPSNIMTRGNEVFLLDFGLATSATASAYESGEGSKGTPVYMAPELFADAPATPQSDLFAVGTMLFEALAGRPFFPEASIISWIRQLSTTGPPALGSVLPDAPEEAQRLVDALLQTERSARPSSANDALRLIDGGRAFSSFPVADKPPVDAREHTWTLAELEDLFTGPEIAFHLKSAPARVLWDRTLGEPSDVAEELSAWADFGLTQLGASGIQLSARALEMLEGGLRPRVPLDRESVDDTEALLLAWIRLGEPIATERLARLTSLDFGTLDQVLDRLAERRLIREHEGWRRVRDVDVLNDMPVGWIDRARASLLENIHEPMARFELALTTKDEVAIRRAGLVAGNSLADKGDTAAAHTVFRTTVVRLRGLRSKHLPSVLAAWGRFACKQNSVELIEEVLWSWGKHDLQLRGLLEGRRSGLLNPGVESAERLEQLGEFADPELEFYRLSSIGVARGGYADTLSQNTERLSLFADRHPEFPDFSAAVRQREAHKKYWSGEYGRAAQLHLQAASLTSQPIWRYRAIVNAVWSLIDDFDFDVAAELAKKNLDEVRALRHPHLELQFHAAYRQALYRGGAELEPSDDMIAAAMQVGYQPLINVLVLQEASVRWRRGDRADAANVARITARKWSANDENWPMLPVVVLHAFLTYDSLTGTVLEAIDTCPYPRLQAQMLGLASYLVPEKADEMRDRARRLVPPEHHSVRLEVLAIDEIDRLV